MTRIPMPKTAVEECPHCGTLHTCEIEHDEDGAYVDLDTTVCSDDHCTVKLCSECSSAKCTWCDLLFCSEHMTRVEDGAEPADLCIECLKTYRRENCAAVEAA